MASNDQVYINLQRHLNNQAVGFPATKSGAEIKILKHIFTPQEAELTSCLTYKFASVKQIYNKARPLAASEQELDAILQRILKKGGIEVKTIDGVRHYRCVPLIVGMFEFQQQRLTPEFVKDFNAYTSDKAFGLEFISTKLPQMRTIPVHKSIHPTHNVSTYDEVSSLVQQSKGPFAIFECICRKKKTIEGKTCKVTDRKETCLGIGEMTQVFVEMNGGRAIDKSEAISILEENQKEGLVLQPSNTKDIDFVCSCCGCCCGILRMHKILPKPLDYWATNYFAVVAADTCSGCGSCQDTCQVGAIRVSEEDGWAVVNQDRCIGCGHCAVNCPTGSISLDRKSKQTIPPQDREELLDIIMENKKGKLGKMMITGKLIYDAIRSRQTHLLR